MSGGNIPWGNIPGWNFPGGILRGGNCLEPFIYAHIFLNSYVILILYHMFNLINHFICKNVMKSASGNDGEMVTRPKQCSGRDYLYIQPINYSNIHISAIKYENYKKN